MLDIQENLNIVEQIEELVAEHKAALNELDEFQADPVAYFEEDLEKLFDEFLVETGSISLVTMKENDPIMYREEFLNWVDAMEDEALHETLKGSEEYQEQLDVLDETSYKLLDLASDLTYNIE